MVGVGADSSPRYEMSSVFCEGRNTQPFPATGTQKSRCPKPGTTKRIKRPTGTVILSDVSIIMEKVTGWLRHKRGRDPEEVKVGETPGERAVQPDPVLIKNKPESETEV